VLGLKCYPAIAVFKGGKIRFFFFTKKLVQLNGFKTQVHHQILIHSFDLFSSYFQPSDDSVFIAPENPCRRTNAITFYKAGNGLKELFFGGFQAKQSGAAAGRESSATYFAPQKTPGTNDLI